MPNNKVSYITLPLKEVRVGEPLPAELFLYIDYRFIHYRNKGETFDSLTFERFQAKGIEAVFVRRDDEALFKAWTIRNNEMAHESREAVPEQLKSFELARTDLRKKTEELFRNFPPTQQVSVAIEASRAMVSEFMKAPYSFQSLSLLQANHESIYDHSVNVSVLSVYVALQMGYQSLPILQNMGTGALLHDIGKAGVEFSPSDTFDDLEMKMRSHVEIGESVLAADPTVPEEVRMIVSQHHECHDGTGYPRKLKGEKIYELARIVSIVNEFDELVANESGAMHIRQKKALDMMEKVVFAKFDPTKLEKILRILRFGA